MALALPHPMMGSSIYPIYIFHDYPMMGQTKNAMFIMGFLHGIIQKTTHIYPFLSHDSLDWFKGKSTGNHQFSH
jgi:hypothetical protein